MAGALAHLGDFLLNLLEGAIIFPQSVHECHVLLPLLLKLHRPLAQERLGVRQQMLQGVQSYPTSKRTEWMQKWPGQVVLNGSQVHWTAETEAALDEKGNQGTAC